MQATEVETVAEMSTGIETEERPVGMPLGRLLRKGPRGATPGEVILYMVLAGLILGAGIFAYTKGSELLAQYRTERLLSHLRGSVAKIMQGQGSYASLSVDLLDERSAIPDAWRIEETVSDATCDGTADVGNTHTCVSMVHPFDGGVTVFGSGKRFWIGFESMDDSACQDLLTPYSNATRSRSGVAAAHVSATTITAAPTTPSLATPFDLSDIAGECDEGDDSNHVYIQFG